MPKNQWSIKSRQQKWDLRILTKRFGKERSAKIMELFMNRDYLTFEGQDSD